MQQSEESEEEEPELPPFDWEKLIRWLLVGGLLLWVLAGAIQAVVYFYFGNIASGFFSGSEASARAAAETYKISSVVESIAFKTWVASAVLVAFLWLRRLLRDRLSQPST